jgi:hypothetical protein
MLRALAVLLTYLHSGAFMVAIVAGVMSFGILGLRLIGIG